MALLTIQMSGKKLLLLLAATVSIVTGVAAFLLWPEPGPYRASYEAIKLGMVLKDVEHIVQPVPADDRDLTRFSRSIRTFYWEGLVDGQPKRVDRDGRIPPKLSQELTSSLLFGRGEIKNQLDSDQPIIFEVWQNGKQVARGRNWEAPSESLIVLFDMDGRVIERALVTIHMESNWVRGLREMLGISL